MKGPQCYICKLIHITTKSAKGERPSGWEYLVHVKNVSDVLSYLPVVSVVCPNCMGKLEQFMWKWEDDRA